jgi:hypothetical protein
MKICSSCEQEKRVCDFYKDKRKTDGLHSRCKLCHAKTTNAWRAKNREKARTIDRKSTRKRYAANPQKYRNLAQKYRDVGDKAMRSAYNALYREKNAEKKRERAKAYYAANTDIVKQRSRIRFQRVKFAQRPINNERTRRRRIQKLQAVPHWANIAEIRRIYARCAEISALTGMVHHVDHIVPLQSMFVCGLHVEQNLQILLASKNLSKGNRSWPDSPDVLPYPKPRRRKLSETVAPM